MTKDGVESPAQRCIYTENHTGTGTRTLLSTEAVKIAGDQIRDLELNCNQKWNNMKRYKYSTV